MMWKSMILIVLPFELGHLIPQTYLKSEPYPACTILIARP